MTRSEYMVALMVALTNAGFHNVQIPGDQMTAVAKHLPTNVLRAVIDRAVMYDEDEDGFFKSVKGAIPFHMGWIQACDDELTDRILTGDIT